MSAVWSAVAAFSNSSAVASVFLRASWASLSAASAAVFASAGIFSPLSAMNFSAVKTPASRRLRASASSRVFLSSSAWSSASLRSFSTSSLERPEEPVMEIFCSLPEPLSTAETCRMPLASMSKVTSIWGSPRRAGLMPSSLNVPSCLLSFAIGRSPWTMMMSTAGWLSAAVEKIWDFLVGMVVLRSIIAVATLPMVSMDRVSGVTSRRRTSFTSPLSTPA